MLYHLTRKVFNTTLLHREALIDTGTRLKCQTTHQQAQDVAHQMEL